MQLLTDVHGRSIRLTDERSTHLHTAHLEMSDQLPRIVATLVYSDQIVRSSTDSTVELLYKHYPSTPVTSKFLCTVVKVLPEDYFVITAYYTDTIKRGDVLWTKK